MGGPCKMYAARPAWVVPAKTTLRRALSAVALGALTMEGVHAHAHLRCNARNGHGLTVVAGALEEWVELLRSPELFRLGTK